MNPSGKIASISAKGFYSYVDHLMTNQNRPNYKMLEASAPVTSATVGGRLELGLKPSKNIMVYTGIDARNVAKDGIRQRLVKIMNGNPVEPPKLFEDKIWQDSWMNNVGLFAEGNFHLAEQWDLVAGVRLDHVISGADDPAEDFEELYGGIDTKTNWNGSITSTLRYLPINNIMLQLSLGRGQRSPDLLERYINHFQVGMDAYEYVGDPNLNPEINNQVDLTIFGSFGRFEIDINVFYSYLEQYITAIVDEDLPRKYMPQLEPVYAKRFINIDDAWQTGFDLNAGYQFTDYLKLTGGMYYTRAQNVDFNEPLPEIPPFAGIFSLLFKKQKVWTEFKGRIAASQEKVSESFNESETPGFEVFDLLAAYTPWKNITFSLQLKNIFNENYYEHLSRSYKNHSEQMMFYEPGRQFRIGLKLNF
jgi:iron complex outermembrane receptor protein